MVPSTKIKEVGESKLQKVPGGEGEWSTTRRRWESNTGRTERETGGLSVALRDLTDDTVNLTISHFQSRRGEGRCPADSSESSDLPWVGRRGAGEARVLTDRSQQCKPVRSLRQW